MHVAGNISGESLSLFEGAGPSLLVASPGPAPRGLVMMRLSLDQPLLRVPNYVVGWVRGHMVR